MTLSRPLHREVDHKIGTFYPSVDETLSENGWLPNRNTDFGVGNVRSAPRLAA